MEIIEFQYEFIVLRYKFIIRCGSTDSLGAASHDVDFLAAEFAGARARLLERMHRQRPIAEWAGDGKSVGGSHNEPCCKGAPEKHKIAHIPNRKGQQFEQQSNEHHPTGDMCCSVNDPSFQLLAPQIVAPL